MSKEREQRTNEKNPKVDTRRIVWVEHSRDALGLLLLRQSAVVVATIERVKVEGLLSIKKGIVSGLFYHRGLFFFFLSLSLPLRVSSSIDEG